MWIRRSCSLVTWMLAAVCAGTAMADTRSIGHGYLSEPIGEVRTAPVLAPLVAEKAQVDLLEAEIGARDALEAMRAYNLRGTLPVQNGVTRELFVTLALDGATDQAAGGISGWTGRVGVVGAWRLRARLDAVALPAGARLWVWGEGEAPRGFGSELVDEEGGLWTPSVSGPSLYLHVEWSGAEKPVLEVSRLLQLFPSADPFLPAAAEKTACLRDATCVEPAEFPGITAARGAIAHLQFVANGQGSLCSGGLLNDTDNSTAIPLLLTANHCFETQASATSLEAFWDYQTTSCEGSIPSLASLPRSTGATLLATSANTDVTLVRLNSVPADRWLLGWDARSEILVENLPLHRVSHPVPAGITFPQAYSRTRLKTGGTPSCTGLPRPQFFYSEQLTGGTYGGSSGSPVMLGSGQVVGQLFGQCGPDPQAGCDYSNRAVDGALTSSWPLLAPYLNPAPTNTNPCVPNATTLCISNNPGDNRFEAKISFQSASASGEGGAVSTNSLGLGRGGLFWFFNAANPEMLLKILNACPLNNRFWVFYAATTNVQFVLTIRDTTDGSTKTYTNPLGVAAQPVQDTNAFATCP